MKSDLKRIRITGFRKHYKILMQELHRSGIVQIDESPEFVQKSVTKDVDDHFGVFDLARTQFAIDFLSPFAPAKKKLDNILSGGKLVLREKEAKERLKNFGTQAHKIIEECETLEADLVKSKNELVQIPMQLELAKNLHHFKSGVSESYETDQTQTWIGKVPVTSQKSFLEIIAAESNLLDVQVLGKDKKFVYVRITALKELMEFISQKLQEYQFEALSLTDIFDGFEGNSISEIKYELEKKEKRLVSDIASFEAQISKLAEHHDDLKILFEYNQWRKTKNDLQQKIFISEQTFAFEGWIIASGFEKCKTWVKNAFVGEVIIEAIEIEEGQEMPVLLSNKLTLNSFEPVTEMYGLPQAKEFDPTPFFAPFFLIFFGLCLSDVGYGSILAGIAAVFLVFGQFSSAAKVTLRLLLYCGMAAIVGGILLGGYFGITPEQMPFLVNPETGKFYGQMINPTEGSGPITFLIISLALGAIQLLFGMLIAFAQQIKNKDYDGAFFDTAAWIFALSTIGLFGLSEMIGFDQTTAKYLAITGAVGLVLTQGRQQKNWLLKPVFGLLGLYNITNYLSDLLSYSRIMALGLATGVVGFAMNLTAGIFGEMMPNPILGIVIATFVVLFGHFLNFSLSLLGAFIHSGRLQFIEFFGKFYEGGGSKFNPFVRQSKYLFLKGE